VTLVYAHRGARREAPENTVPAFRRALELGADGVELDVRRTRDGELVVRHDADGPLGVWAEHTLAEIRAADPAIPVLAEALDACRGAIVNVEIKNSPRDADWDPSDQAADLLVGCLAGRDGDDRVLVSSFDLPTIDRVRSLAPHLPTALLTQRGDPLEGLLIAESHGHPVFHPSVRQLGGRKAGALVVRAHERAVAVNAWTGNDPGEIARLAAAGIDGICTDVPDVALSVLGRRG
jgi:glycerophosphoryl diester phosphodiesterase